MELSRSSTSRCRLVHPSHALEHCVLTACCLVSQPFSVFGEILISDYDQRWNDNTNGIAPIGSINVQVNSSNAPAVEMNPLNATVDPNNILQFPPMDNSTGVWQLYTPRNDTTSTKAAAAPASDCAFAANHGARLYWQECQSQWSSGSRVLRYRITISGTGYVKLSSPTIAERD